MANVHRSYERQLVEPRLLSMRIGCLANVLGTYCHGPVHAQNHRIWNSGWRRRWLGALPYVQAGHSRCKPSEISEFRSRSVVSVSSMGGQPQNPRRYGNQNGSVYSLVSSVDRAINWNNPTRVFGPVAVLDGNGFRNKTCCVRGLLQQASNSRWSQGKNSDRNDGIEGCQSQVLSLAPTLSSAVPNTNRRMRINSPRTGPVYGERE